VSTSGAPPPPPSAPSRAPARPPEAPPLGGRAASLTLAVLVLVYVLNFLDRQIVTILAEDIKADLGISDAQIGFLYGTAFAVFYAVFGIPLGRLADVWVRRSLIAAGLAFWSLATAVSGFTRSFAELGTARVGVGVGEASATPAAYSMLSDSFPPRVRATVLAIYSSGIYIGGGLGLLIGGQIVDRWNAAFPDGGAPLGLSGWQAAFLAVGLPGLLLALVVRALPEPVRGAADGIPSRPEPHPFREFFLELRSVIPPFTFYHLWRCGAGRRGLVGNVGAALGVAAGAGLLARVTGNGAQWLAFGLGLYASISWAQSLRLRDPVAAVLIFRTPSLLLAGVGFAFLAFTGYGLAAWTPPFFLRVHGESAAAVGTIVGITAAVAGVIGLPLGGWLADRRRRLGEAGRLHVAILAALLPVPLAYAMLAAESPFAAYAWNVPLAITTSAWIGIGASTIQDLVLPRMRASASAFYLLLLTLIGFALGPYTMGALSDATGDLPDAIRLGVLANGLAVAFLWLATRTLGRDERTLRARARAAGEAFAAEDAARV